MDVQHNLNSLLHSPSSSVLFKEVVFAYHCWLYHILLSISRTMQLLSRLNKQPAIIHTDGSILSAKTDKSGAGFGVFFGKGDARNIAAPLSAHDKAYNAKTKDNQRAELAGIQKGLKYIAESPMKQRYVLKTDSKDSVERINGRVSHPSRNEDLVRSCSRLNNHIKHNYAAKQWDFNIQHVESRKNAGADHLARKGARCDSKQSGQRKH